MLLRYLAFLSVIGGCFSTSVLAEPKVLHVTETGFMVENKVTISQPADKVWHALINQVDKWWPKDHTWWGNDSVLSIDEFAGGCFCEKVGYKSAEHMRISFVEPQKLLRMTGGLGPLQGMGMHGALDWAFATTDEGTHITLTYRVSGIDPNGFEKLAPIVAQVQGMQLQGLADFLKE